jgi:putative endonuclease
MLECENGALYTGVAVDVAARYALHCGGKGAKYTRANKPRRIAAIERCAGRSSALKLEAKLKALRRPEKLAWAAKRKLSPAASRPSRPSPSGNPSAWAGRP